MATASRRFAASITDFTEIAIIHCSAVPCETKACTKWGVELWSDLSSARIAASFYFVSQVSLTTALLEMPVEDFAHRLTLHGVK